MLHHSGGSGEFITNALEHDGNNLGGQEMPLRKQVEEIVGRDQSQSVDS